jgi:predicted MFS family arabinose efflux permease
MLLLGAGLMLLAGLVFALTDNFLLLLIAATVGVISPSGNEIGPFLSVEQASLSQTVSSSQRTSVFAWYNLIGFSATALGSWCGGQVTQFSLGSGLEGADAYRPVVILYGVLGVAMAAFFWLLSATVEVERPESKPDQTKRLLGLHQSRGIVLKLSALFALDAFAGGFIVQTLLAWWFHVRFGHDPATLGWIFFGANLMSGVSALAAGWLANRFGLINTMVFTHLPSNVLLIFVPLAPNGPLAIALLILRHSISQMDVPTRQSYTMAVVHPDERSAAAGVTAVARSIGSSLSPWLAALLIAYPAMQSAPFFVAGGLKIIYDLWLYRAFAHTERTKNE